MTELGKKLVKETRVEVTQFSSEARKALENKGYSVYTLSGKSIRSFREGGNHFWTDWHNDRDFEGIATEATEVAVNPGQLFLEDSNRKSLFEQRKMVGKFSNRLVKKVPGAKAIIGKANQYAELAFRHFEETGERLFGESNGYGCARTETPVVSFRFAAVGGFRKDGLGVIVCFADVGDDDIWVAPLVVPA